MATTATQHPEFQQEREYLGYALNCLDGMIRTTEDLPRAGMNAAAQRALREMSHSRLGPLMAARREIYFGRMDSTDGRFAYLGRQGVMDRDDIVVMSWAAKQAKAWYLASPSEPSGLVRKRHLRVQGSQVLEIRDESLGQSGNRVFQGGSLDRILEDLQQDRSGRMADVVATIQEDQYRLISQQLEGVLVVQGGPGTGKTAVALHRAAWLRYQEKEGLKSGILLVGPNEVFLDYISDVLPSIGDLETKICLVSQLNSRLPVSNGDEPARRARLKGDPRMAEALHEALRRRIRAPLEDAEFQVQGLGQLKVGSALLKERLEAVLRKRKVPYNEAQKAFWEYLLEDLYAEGSFIHVAEFKEFHRLVSRSAPWQKLVNAVWARFLPQDLVGDLLDVRSKWLLETSLLSSEECNLLWDRQPRTSRQWTLADVALLDEADFLLNGLGEEDRFDHVIVDEAQDLSPMQLRALGRRARRSSLTLVGDMAQATGTWIHRSWAHLVEHLGTAQAHYSELRVSYRVPSQIMDVAVRLLPEIDQDLPLPVSVRAGKLSPVQIDGSVTGSLATAARIVRRITTRFTSTVGVIVPSASVDDMAACLEAEGVDKARVGRNHLKSTPEQLITVTTPLSAKGVEFDLVIVVEPKVIAEQGLKELFVALTRPTQHLVLVHSQGLPAFLEPVPSDTAEHDPWEYLGPEAMVPGAAGLVANPKTDEPRPYTLEDVEGGPRGDQKERQAMVAREMQSWLVNERRPVPVVYAIACLRRLLQSSKAWGSPDITVTALRDLSKNRELAPVMQRAAEHLFPGVRLDREPPK